LLETFSLICKLLPYVELTQPENSVQMYAHISIEAVSSNCIRQKSIQCLHTNHRDLTNSSISSVGISQHMSLVC